MIVDELTLFRLRCSVCNECIKLLPDQIANPVVLGYRRQYWADAHRKCAAKRNVVAMPRRDKISFDGRQYDSGVALPQEAVWARVKKEFLMSGYEELPAEVRASRLV